MKEYFDNYINTMHEVNRLLLDLSRKLHRECFVVLVKYRLDIMLIEEIIEQINYCRASKSDMEKVDKDITIALNYMRKKIEG